MVFYRFLHKYMDFERQLFGFTSLQSTQLSKENDFQQGITHNKIPPRESYPAGAISVSLTTTQEGEYRTPEKIGIHIPEESHT